MATRKKRDAAPASSPDVVRPRVAERGEIALNLDGQDLILRPSHEAIVEFEAVTGQGLMQLTRAALDGSMGLGTAAQIATECVKAWGRATNSASAMGVNAPRIAELMLETEGGYHTALATISGMLALASTGGYTASGELKPAAKTKT